MITLINIETGQTIEAPSGVNFRHPWKVQPPKRKIILSNPKHFDKYPYKKCSNCGNIGVFEST